MWNINICFSARKHWVKHKKWGVVTGTDLSIESDGNDVLLEKYRVDGNINDSAKSGEPADKESEKLSVVSGGIDKVGMESKKDTGNNKGSDGFLFAKPNESNPLAKDVAKVTGGVGVGTVAGVVVTKVVMSNLVGNKGGSNTEKGLENINEKFTDIEEKLEKVKNERDAFREQNEKFKSIPAHRAWLWGFLSYPLEWLELLREGQKDTETLAIKNNGLRIMFSVIWLLASIFTTLIVWVLARGIYCKNTKTTSFCAIPTTLLVWLCPPAGVVYGVFSPLFISKQKN